MALKLSEKQHILEIQDVMGRLERVLGIIEGEIDVSTDREAHPWPR